MKTLQFFAVAAVCGCLCLETSAKTAAADAEGLVRLDFSDQMNMDLEDEIAGDEKGGWNDHGENDARNFPLGRAKYCNVPFRVIDPAANNRKALLVPKNHRLEKGPDAATAEVVPAAPAKFLYLMHAAAWEAKQRSDYVGSIVFTDERGKTEEIRVKLFEDCWGWWDWSVKDHTNAYVCARIPALEGTGYMYVSEFRVPAALGKIAKVTFKSAGRETSGAYWMIMAATLANDEKSRREIEKPKPPFVINQLTPGWKKIRFPKENGVLAGSILDNYGTDLVPVGKYGRLVSTADGRLVYEKRPDLEFRSSCSWTSDYWNDFLMQPGFAARVKKGEKMFVDFAGVPYTNDIHTMISEFAKAFRRSGYRILRICGLPGMGWSGLDFDDDQLDNFFWMIKCFRDNGIYIHLDTPGSFTWNDAWWRWGDNHLGRAWLDPSMAYWRKEIRENWREGMKRYFTIVNPYTKCALKDEPVVAFLELANEANMRSRPFTGEPEAHAEMAKFLKEKYGDLAGVKKAWGEHFDDSWKSLETIPVDFLWQEGRGRKGARHQDMQELYVRRMQWLLDWHLKVLKDEIGCRQMITEYNMIQALGHSAARRPADYIAHNAYFNHPAGKTLSPNSVIAAKNSWMRGFVSCQYAARPYVITEADIVFFSPKRYEQPFMLNGYAALNGIDVVNGFCLTFPIASRNGMGDWGAAKDRTIWHFFGWYDPMKLASEFLGAHFTTRGKIRESDVTCRVILDEREILNAGDMTAGLGSDQTQLALVTRFGIAFRDQLARDRPPKGAKVFDMPRSGATEIVREKLFSNMIDATDANGFDAQKAVDAMKAKGWIPQSNRTDVQKGVYESSTGELYMDVRRKYGTVNAPAAQGLFAEKGATAKLNDFEVVAMDADAMLCAVSHGDEPLKESKRIAVVFATNALNDDMAFTDETMSEWIRQGRAPVIVRCAKATFRVRSKFAKDLRCWAVDLNGRRTDPIAVKSEGEWVTVSVDTARLAHGPAIFFELAAEPNVPAVPPEAPQVRQKVAFLGGSITEMWGYRPRVMNFLKQIYPNVVFEEIAAGLSSTCSDTAAFRLSRDVLSKGTPDIFILDAAVNDDQDGNFDLKHAIRGYEGVVRRVLEANPKCRVVLAQMVNHHQYGQIQKNEKPIPYEAGKAVAARYGVAIADVGTSLVRSAKEGGISWKEYGDCHPSGAGCDFGAKLVMEAILKDYDPMNPPEAKKLPAPLDARSYFASREIDLTGVKGEAWKVEEIDWKAVPGSKRGYFTQGPVLWSDKTNAEASVTFRGTALGALLTAGPDAGDLEVSVDGGAFRKVALKAYYGDLHYPYTQMLADDLKEGEHTVRFRIVPAQRGKGTGTTVRINRLYANGQ